VALLEVFGKRVTRGIEAKSPKTVLQRMLPMLRFVELGKICCLLGGLH